ncbi:Acylphosphatase [Patellaria atrata CBS 101060]|uniref:Acylphosphatase n=1 Tax=Patellaria atrata CBS 101060 TaxID=1346257 RepID=A0A9P4S448_9PEZI|nr:Acylphosphatase [Patellaria atrata CBS 101060]
MRLFSTRAIHDMSNRISYKVTGEVQGVCFRQGTVEQAKNLNVTGWVRNASDGSVEGEAQGDKGSLDSFVKYLNKGPSAANVSNVEKSDLDPKDGESSFTQK